jgi:hypothetical protein
VTYLESLTPEERGRAMPHSSPRRCLAWCFTAATTRTTISGRAELAQVPLFRCPPNTMRFINRRRWSCRTVGAHENGAGQQDILGIGVLLTGAPGSARANAPSASSNAATAWSPTMSRRSGPRRLGIGTSARSRAQLHGSPGIGLVNVLAMFGVMAHETTRIWWSDCALGTGDAEHIERWGRRWPRTKSSGSRSPR